MRLPRIVIALGVVSLLTDISSEMILPLLPSIILGTMGSTTILVGLVDGVADALSAVLKLVAGRLSDSSARRKPFVLAGYSLSTIVRPLVSLAILPWQIVLVRAVDRVGKGLRSAPRDALIGDAVPAADAPRAYAFHRLMDHTGAIVGPLVASVLLAVGLGAREAIMLAWIPGALAVVCLALFVREAPRAVVVVSTPSSPAGLSPELRRFLAVVGLFSLGVAGDTFVVVRAREVGVPDSLLPIVWSVLHAAKVAAASAVGRANTQSTGVIGIAWALAAMGLALLAVDSVAFLWAGAVVLGLAHGAREPVEKAVVRAHAPDAQRGRAFGAYHLTTGLAALPAGLGVGALWHSFGAPVALLSSAAVVATAALSLAVVPKHPGVR